MILSFFDSYAIVFIYVLSVILLALLIITYLLLVRNRLINSANKKQLTALNAIYGSVPDMIISKDFNLAYTSCNHNFEIFAGIGEAELIGKTSGDVAGLSNRLPVNFKEIEEKVIENSVEMKTNEWFTFPDGARRYFEAVLTPVVSDGEVTGLLGFMRDITDLKILADSAQAAHEIARAMIDTSPLGCFIYKDDNVIIDCNDEVVRLFEVDDREEFMARFFSDFLLATQPDGRVLSEVRDIYMKKAKEYGRYSFGWECLLPDGSPLPTIITLVSTDYGDGDFTFTYLQDLRELNRMTARVEKQNRFLESLNQMASILLAPDLDDFNDALTTALSIVARAVLVDRVSVWKFYTRDGLLRCTMVCEWEGNAESKAGFLADNVFDVGQPGWGEILARGQCVSGLTRDFPPGNQVQLKERNILSVFVTPVFIGDDFWGFVGFDDCTKERNFTENESKIMRSAGLMIANAFVRNDMTRDILEATEKLATAVDKANAAARAKSAFLAHMSHEIRTPMNAIIGMTELALRDNDPNILREHIITIKQAGSNLLSIINDVLDVSKIEAGNLEISPAPYHVSSLLSDVINIIRIRIMDSPVRFTVNVDCNIPNLMKGDEVRIRQILINLLGNAVKFTDKGFISLNVKYETINDNSINLIFEIEDSGKGIKREHMETIFSEYVQFESNSRRGIEGVGLGLTITVSLVKAMDGEVFVESEYGIGSKFTVKLPQKIAAPEKIAFLSNPENKKALVYERRDIYSDSIRRSIENLGGYCAVASNEIELEELASGDTFNFVFTSYTLYERSKHIILKSRHNAKIVLLAEFGEKISERGLSVLSMPIYCLSIAGILNNVSDNYLYSEVDETIVRFTAPNAKVLVVDDINTNLRVAKGLLMPYKMQIDVCSSGIEAIEAVKNMDYDLVFMDHRMPEMDGVEATAHIRALAKKENEPYYSDLPIVALTANAVAGTKEMFLENGFNDYISKPIDTIKLNTVLEQLIPREKQKGLGYASDNAAAHTDTEQADNPPPFEIEGIDSKKGLSISANSLEHYTGTLATFVEDAAERIEQLKKHTEEKDMNAYAICVHALKSAAGSIGADETSSFAYKLELAAKQGDLDFIKSGGGDFIGELETLLGGIKKALSEYVLKTEKDSAGADGETGEFIKEELAILAAALRDMNAGAINTAVSALQKLTRATDFAETVRNISTKILMSEYDEAAELIKETRGIL